ncbi:Uu.00g075770.m01.CDS01 [Anthostomella pinea]|uniref:Uu.00g075770.m01.CDS01 n=1 Tax=Anthostomella pinea TaxID=933095 RepID=A0AAI8VVR3_9PEZI|nr:Uu.00g075770.m01.CDS01 [Anthostomella pinea]
MSTVPSGGSNPAEGSSSPPQPNQDEDTMIAALDPLSLSQPPAPSQAKKNNAAKNQLELEPTINLMKDDADKDKAKLDSTQSRTDSTERNMQVLKSTNQRLKVAMPDKKAQLESAAKKQRELESTIQRMKADADKDKAELDSTQSKLNTAQGIIQELQLTMDRMTDDAKAVKAIEKTQPNIVEANNQEIKTECDSLAAALEKAQMELKKALGKLRKTQGELKSTTDERDKVAGLLKKADGYFKLSESKLRGAKDKLRVAKVKLRIAKVKLRIAKDELRIAKDERDKLKAKLHDMESASSNATGGEDNRDSQGPDSAYFWAISSADGKPYQFHYDPDGQIQGEVRIHADTSTFRRVCVGASYTHATPSGGMYRLTHGGSHPDDRYYVSGRELGTIALGDFITTDGEGRASAFQI